MGDKTAIEWADETLNVLVGCSKVSPGCDFCYAINTVHRGMSPQHRGLTVRTEDERTDWTGEIRFVEHLLDLPLRQKRPRKIFLNSLSDLFHPDVLNLRYSDDPEDERAPLIEILAMMVAADWHTFQVLTKRPQIMAAVLTDPGVRLRVNARLLELGHDVMPGGMTDPDFRWPKHIWFGTSIENQTYAFRAKHLVAAGPGTAFLSVEPLIGPVTLDLDGIDWVIAGGESGPGARPMHPAWPRSVRDQCVEAGVPFLFKQHGSWQVGARASGNGGRLLGSLVLNDGEVLPWDDKPTPNLTQVVEREATVMSRAPKAETGRTLDGRTWDQYPEP